MRNITSATFAIAAIVVLAATATLAGVIPPDPNACNGIDCTNVQNSLCSDAGFQITLVSFSPANASNSGACTYTYSICQPVQGVCSNDGTQACSDNSTCWTNHCQGGNGPNANTCSQDHLISCTSDKECNAGVTCSVACAVDKFHGLSHFDVNFPELGASCLSETTTQISGTCACTTNGSGTCAVGGFVLGDGSCYTGSSPVAKCDSTTMGPGDCITMTLSIAGELNGLGVGPVVVVDKEATTCTASCMSGPSCTPCVGPQQGSECLTRTIGFWGTHPWITNDYDPVTVCGKTLGCYGAPDTMSDPTCLAGSCDSIMEGLGSIGGESPRDSAYISMVKQLTAAKLNLNATADLFNGANCNTWTYNGRDIAGWISYCEGLCGANQSTISGSGCVEALNAFNNSGDSGFTVTPAPFDRPPVDDFGNISGANPSQFTAAQGNSTPPGKLVIGKKTKDHNCQ